jgi:predicted TIM-barrel fold metal-dependent hydrolase
MKRHPVALALLVGAAACPQHPRAPVPAGQDAGAKQAPLSRVDVHVHTDPEMYPLTLKLLQRAGIERFVNLSGGAAGDGLEESVHAARAWGGRILVCSNVNWAHVSAPDFGKSMAEDLKRAAALGAVCLKIPKALGLRGVVPGEQRPLPVDDARLAPLWETAGQLAMPVFIHVGDPKAFWQPVTPENERYEELRLNPEWSFADPRHPTRDALLTQFENLLRNHPGTTFVGVHFGNDPEDLDATDNRLNRFPNLFIDTAARVPEIGRNAPAKLRAFFIRHQDRIMFGSDFGMTLSGMMLGAPGGTQPTVEDALRFFAVHWRFFEGTDQGMAHPTPIQGRWTVNAPGLPPDVLRRFYMGNAERLLKWPALTR